MKPGQNDSPNGVDQLQIGDFNEQGDHCHLGWDEHTDQTAGENQFFAFELQLGEAATARNAAGTRPAAFDVLTPREFEIVELMAQRLSNRKIAEQLYLSEGSVKQYVNQIYSKLHIEGDTRTKRAQLARLLREKT